MPVVNLRRALFLFAIVLGLAALAAGLSRPSDDSDGEPAGAGQPALTEPSVSGAPAEVRFDASDPRRRAVFAGQAAEVYVEVDRPGQVVIQGLGLSAVAEPVTPARFDVLVERTGSYPLQFVPAGNEPSERAGTLVVKQPEPGA
jgi:hypothetical protein